MKTAPQVGYQHISYKTLSSKQRRMLENILIRQSKTGEEKGMVKYLTSLLSSFPSYITFDIDKMNNIYVTKNNSDQTSDTGFYPLLVAHTDTVHKILPFSKDMKEGDKKTDYYTVYKYPSNNNKGYTYDSDTGIGGDDKNGIFILLTILQDHRIPKVKVLFSTSEENGGRGAQFALSQNPSFFSDISYIIEPDRRGNRDIICKWGSGFSISPDFRSLAEPIWESMGFSIENGSFTDAFFIFEDIEVSTFNISCGYYKPHSSGEYVIEHDIKRTLDTILFLLEEIPLNIQWKKKHEPYIPPKKTYPYNPYYNTSSGNSPSCKGKRKKDRNVTYLMEHDDTYKTGDQGKDRNDVFGRFRSPIDDHSYYGYYNDKKDTFTIYNLSMIDITSKFNLMEHTISLLTFITEYADLFHHRSLYDILTLSEDLNTMQDNLDLHLSSLIEEDDPLTDTETDTEWEDIYGYD